MVYKPTIVNIPHISDVLPCIPRRMLARRRSNYLAFLSVFLCCYIIAQQPLLYKNPNAIRAEDLLFGCPRLVNYKGDEDFSRVGVITPARPEFNKVIWRIVSQSQALYFMSPSGRMTPQMQRKLYLWSANATRSFDVALGSSKCSAEDIEMVINKSHIQTFYVFYDYRDFPKYTNTDSLLDYLQCFINVLDAIKEREVKKAIAKQKSAFIPVHVILRLDMISRYQTLLFRKLSGELNHHFDNITLFSLGEGHCKAEFQFRNDYEAYFYSIHAIAKTFREVYGLDITVYPVY